MTLKHIIIASTLALISLGALASPKDDPKANPKAVVEFDNARFTILTDKLVRMEWAENGQFEDRASLAIVNRNLDVPQFTVRKSGGKLTITTAALTLTYTGGKFDGKNLKIEFTMADPSARKGTKKVVWNPSMEQTGNLLGTTRTLDGCDGHQTREPYDLGVLSRDGWAVIDESTRPLLREDNSDWGSWIEERDSTDRLDLYFFGYGHEYKEALKDFTKVAGRIPLPPKYVFGYWWSRYWQYSDFEFVGLAKMMRSLNIPIDIMVIDMDWHETWTLAKKNAPKDEYGQRVGWTGYTWQEQLFPNPANFLTDIHELGLKTSLNLHPASGIQPYEECYERFVADYTSRTDDYDGPKGFVNEEGKKVPSAFRITDRNWADSYFNSVIHPLENMGVDFWWLDWQQWKWCKYMPTVNNTFWLNHTFFNDKVRQSVSQGPMADRPIIYHRWGGLGSHRYQIGFSGDTYDTWDVLGYLPYFTSTSSNVGYGYWGHDIGGHMQQKAHPTDPELYTRWLQYGIFTPIFKTHSTKTLFLERRIWVFPDHFEAMRDAIRLRYTLSPYIYNAARETFDTGVSMCRPMYYDYPEENNAYEWKKQHMFGGEILAIVLDSPADAATGLTSQDVWFPAGCNWYDMATGTTIEGGQCKSLSYTISEIPYFVKAGAVIPMAAPTINSLQEQSDEIYLMVAPGAGNFTTNLYEDDGKTQAYDKAYATTKISKTSDSKHLTLTVAAREGSYEGMAEGRRVRVVLEGILPPKSVKVNGEEVTYSRFAKEGEWGYDGMELHATIILPQTPASEEIVIECELDEASTPALMNGKKGLIKRMAAITPETKLVFGSNVDSYGLLPKPFLKIAQCGSLITEFPQDAQQSLEAIDVESLNETFASYEKLPQEYKDKIKAQVSF